MPVSKLFDQLRPKHYELFFEIDPYSESFSGKLELTASVAKKTDEIKLHSKTLNVKSAFVNDEKAEISHDSTTDELTLKTNKPVGGELKVDLIWDGELTEHMHGIYPCSFVYNGEPKKLVATQFESHHAREAFPCIDEPAAKATFAVTLTTPRVETVLSNTPAKKQEEIADRLITSFEKTPVMSTYLLAFVIGDMHCVEATTNNDVLVRCWSHPGIEKKHLKYALTEAVRTIEFFEDYFGVPYPLKKCDHVALPDFESGAMENWGLITYRETALLCDPNNRSLPQEQYCSMIIAHEVSHQWFGNLTTMQWWDDLWLNESFASIMEYVALDELHPTWKIWESFVVDDAFRAVSRDVMSGVQPVAIDVEHPDEIHTLFDPSIVYAKGARLLNMLRQYIRDDVFRAGLRKYFTEHAYENTVRGDLWAALSGVSDENISDLMTPWLTQPGLPLLSVSKTGEGLKLDQKRFVVDHPERKSDSIWPVPIFAEPEIETKILLEKQAELNISPSRNYVFNNNASAHMVVNYQDYSMRSKLIEKLCHQELSVENRANIINDLVILSRGGVLSVIDPLKAVFGCTDETREAVWSSMSYAVGAGKTIAEGDEMIEKKFKHAIGKLALPTVNKLGWEKLEADSPNDINVRLTTIGLAAYSEDSTVIEKLRTYYEKYCERWLELDADIRGLVMSAAIKHDFNGAFENLTNILSDSSARPDLKLGAQGGLSSARTKKAIDSVLEILTNEKMIKTQDIFRMFAYLMRNQYSRAQTWDWMIDHWQWISKKFEGTKSFDDFARYSANALNSKQDLEKYRAFFEPLAKKYTGLRRTVDIGCDEILARANWRERDLEPLRNFVSQ